MKRYRVIAIPGPLAHRHPGEGGVALDRLSAKLSEEEPVDAFRTRRAAKKLADRMNTTSVGFIAWVVQDGRP